MPDDSPVPSTQELIPGSFRLTETGLDVIGNPTFEEWLKAGEFIRKSQKAVHFWIGDWLNYGENAWGDRYQEAVKRTGYDVQTLRNDKWVASRIAPQRRQSTLSFDHHASVSNLEEDEQDQLLSEAISQGLNN